MSLLIATETSLLSRTYLTAFRSEFPIAFHDHTGSYVEVNERPTHTSVIKELRQGEFVYSHAEDHYVIQNNKKFGARVDSLMDPQHRASLLLGLLHAGKSEVQHKKDMTGVKLRILARVPSSNEGSRASMAATENTVSPGKTLGGMDLDRSDRAEKWVKQTLGMMKEESDMMHEKEPVNYGEVF